MSRKQMVGNILGDIRAETDYALLDVFVSTPDYLALSATNDFNFVVGRRGTGKSALYIRLYKDFMSEGPYRVFTCAPKEYESLALLSTVNTLTSDYKYARATLRVSWRVAILYTILENISGYYKFNKCDDYSYLKEFHDRFNPLLKGSLFNRCHQVIREIKKSHPEVSSLPGEIAEYFDIENLHRAILNSLGYINKKVIFLFDNLDEGWSPSELDASILGGLASVAADFKDCTNLIHVVLFIRDNMFRCLSVFDRDFSRHIEGNTLRLKWDDQALLHLVSLRLRNSLGSKNVENDVKIWNRFAKNELSNRDGFKECLKYTLYRPRDILVLLNSTFQIAMRSGRQEIVLSDVETASKQISIDRLQDLLKEYDTVFPGVELLVYSFQNKKAVDAYASVVNNLDHFIQNTSYADQRERDFAILDNGQEAFFALFSIGFLGLEDFSTGSYIFCHDGSPANLDAVSREQKICIHPCYWKGLDVQSQDFDVIPVEQIYDDFKPESVDGIQDQRMKLVGQLISELPHMQEGREGAASFEKWVFRTIKILFSGILVNPELKPNGDSVQRRDVVATNNAGQGFWQRIYNDYGVRQVVFEIKNYKELGPDDFRQAFSYLTGEYGSFVIVVTRSDSETLLEKEKNWVKEIWYSHRKLVFIIPSVLLSRCVSKIRKSAIRYDYTDNQLNKRLDTFVRKYISLKSK